MSAALIVRIVRWRWTPCVALVLGSLAFVLAAFAIIPERIGGISVQSQRRVAFDVGQRLPSGALRNDLSGEISGGAKPSLVSPIVPSPVAQEAVSVPPVRTANGSLVVQSLFPSTPPAELPVAPPDPSPPPPPEPPPPPAPSATIYTLPAPPPPPASSEAPETVDPPPQLGPENHP